MSMATEADMACVHQGSLVTSDRKLSLSWLSFKGNTLAHLHDQSEGGQAQMGRRPAQREKKRLTRQQEKNNMHKNWHISRTYTYQTLF